MWGFKTRKKVKELETKIKQLECGIKQIECDHTDFKIMKYTNPPETVYYKLHSPGEIEEIYEKRCTKCDKHLGHVDRGTFLQHLIDENKKKLDTIKSDIKRYKSEIESIKNSRTIDKNNFFVGQ